MELQPCVILKLFINFSDSEPGYSCKLYSYKEKCILWFLLEVLKKYNRTSAVQVRAALIYIAVLYNHLKGYEKALVLE